MNKVLVCELHIGKLTSEETKFLFTRIAHLNITGYIHLSVWKQVMEIVYNDKMLTTLFKKVFRKMKEIYLPFNNVSDKVPMVFEILR
jgi:hypothetical protein